jgi:tRNA A37 threonylcarbamoyladenosine synthetase subunit TsaC/SUA5/YrdC
LDKSLVYLVQTDTTVGFLSSDDKKLSCVKQRKQNQKTLQVVDSFNTLKKHTRIPKQMRKIVRNSKRITFIYPNKLSFRVIDKNSLHHNFINKFNCLYSTSANITKNDYNERFAFDNSDIIVYNKAGFSQYVSSAIYKLNKKKRKKIR